MTKTEEKKTTGKEKAVPQISVEESKEGGKVTAPPVPVLIKEPSPEPERRPSFSTRRGSYVDLQSPAGSRRGSIIIADEVGCQRAKTWLLLNIIC